jgi:hypothetical protein
MIHPQPVPNGIGFSIIKEMNQSSRVEAQIDLRVVQSDATSLVPIRT